MFGSKSVSRLKQGDVFKAPDGKLKTVKEAWEELNWNGDIKIWVTIFSHTQEERYCYDPTDRVEYR